MADRFTGKAFDRLFSMTLEQKAFAAADFALQIMALNPGTTKGQAAFDAARKYQILTKHVEEAMDAIEATRIEATRIAA